MTRYITLTLTHTEASAMLTALGNGMGEEDDMMTLFTGNWRQVQACQRAEQKLRQAFHGEKNTSTLTPQEAKAVSRAAHNILDDEEIARDFFDSSQDLAAARRGTNKLNAIAYGDSE